MEESTARVTLWSETLLDSLVIALKRRDDTEARRLLLELRARGYRRRQVVAFVRKAMQAGDVQHLQALIELMRAKNVTIKSV